MKKFTAPVGTEAERNSGKIWPGLWSDATGFLNKKAPGYKHGIHTGADLNLNFSGGWDSDAHAPVYAIGDGIVTYAQRWPDPKYWGNIIVIDHGIVDEKPLFSRYAHVENIRVEFNRPVTRGQQIAQVGNGHGLFEYHLHFDISISDILKTEPQNWPAPASNKKKELVTRHYVDPEIWLKLEHVVDSGIYADEYVKPSATSTVYYVIVPVGSRLYKGPSMAAEQSDLLPCGTKLHIAGIGPQEGFFWGQISGGKYHGQWLTIKNGDKTETYASTNPP